MKMIKDNNCVVIEYENWKMIMNDNMFVKYYWKTLLDVLKLDGEFEWNPNDDWFQLKIPFTD